MARRTRARRGTRAKWNICKSEEAKEEKEEEQEGAGGGGFLWKRVGLEIVASRIQGGRPIACVSLFIVPFYVCLRRRLTSVTSSKDNNGHNRDKRPAGKTA